MKIESKYLRGYIENRIEMCRGVHSEENSSSGKLQMLARINELEEILHEINMLEGLNDNNVK